jgi:lipoprotein NlpD
MKTRYPFNENKERIFSGAKLIIKSFGLLIFLFAISCAMRDKPAPITNVTAAPATPQSQVAAVANSTAKSDAAKSEVTAIEDDKDDVQEAKTAKNQKADTLSENGANSGGSDKGWVWPTKGSVTQTFKQNGKGINIQGAEGQDINAISGGKVLYSGNGLKGYGNLIIVKHDSTYLSAYAHNKANLIKQGATVKSGQKIATMGKSGARKAILHFEIRRNGKPIDPMTMVSNN